MQNRFFYWSLELVDAFLVKHGILNGHNLVTGPEGVEPLKPEEFDAVKMVVEWKATLPTKVGPSCVSR